jgi:hypothetical protein
MLGVDLDGLAEVSVVGKASRLNVLPFMAKFPLLFRIFVLGELCALDKLMKRRIRLRVCVIESCASRRNTKHEV